MMGALLWLKDVLVTTSTDFNWGIFLGVFLISIVLYIFGGWLLYRIGKKFNYERPWFGWIPIANTYMLVELSTREKSWFWIILITMFIPCVNIVGLVMFIIVWMDIAERCGKPRWWGILFIVPIVNFVIVYILGSGPAVPPRPPAGTQPGQYGPPPQGPQPPYTPPPPPQQ